ncbi:hypothetical protein WMF37_25995 [Sorangium sp. So ce291]|uniref:hypothetical protein n=1 Tax=Sorangium sp. So ce291 TaxID=3133294 RepID=UPI003F637C38
MIGPERAAARRIAPAGAALAAGSVDAARIAHETTGRLLSAPGADAAGVIDLAAERARRGG